tara:strand:- start:13 stop:132 length:120 start_codon:yes stop_codon:yes gene_type:complete
MSSARLAFFEFEGFEGFEGLEDLEEWDRKREGRTASQYL